MSWAAYHLAMGFDGTSAHFLFVFDPLGPVFIGNDAFQELEPSSVPRRRLRSQIPRTSRIFSQQSMFTGLEVGPQDAEGQEVGPFFPCPGG